MALLGGAAVGAASWVTLVPAPSPVLAIDGYEYVIDREKGALSSVRAAIALRERQLLSEPLYLRADEMVLAGSARDLGYRLDRDALTQKALEGIERAHVKPSENFGVWALRRLSSAREVHQLDLEFELDEDQAKERLTEVARVIEREPVDAQLLISEHKIVPSEEGRHLSVDATLVRLRTISPSEHGIFEPVIERTRPRVTEDDLAPVDVTRVLAHYETSFRGKAGARAVNIRAAAKFLDGAMILPGEVLSFNDQVGRRIHGRGFVDAPVILNDELELDVGGGVCQVATTLHAAAVYGNVEIVQRRSHSRPSGYAPLGLDATVIDGKVDLKLRNPFDEPILVHVSFPSEYVVRVELLGRDPDAQIEHAYSVTHVEPFARRVWRREEAPLGGFELKQKGSQGMDVVSVVKVKREDGSESRRTYRSKYYPVPEVFWIGDGASPRTLPEMPKEAVGLVIDGEEVEPVLSPESPEDVPSLASADGSDKEPSMPQDTN
jgi:vancomycin resistance protein YoaR